MEIKNENKKSKLIFDPKLSRKLLKMNGEIKYCPYCGITIDANCECHKNIVIDVKPYRNEFGDMAIDRSVMVFQNNKAFQSDLTQLMEEAATKRAEKEESTEVEQFEDNAF